MPRGRERKVRWKKFKPSQTGRKDGQAKRGPSSMRRMDSSRLENILEIRCRAGLKSLPEGKARPNRSETVEIAPLVATFEVGHIHHQRPARWRGDKENMTRLPAELGRRLASLDGRKRREKVRSKYGSSARSCLVTRRGFAG